VTTQLQRYEQFVLAAWLGADELLARNLRDLYICSTGLPGETGEVCEKLKKYVRDGVLDKDALCRELGDVLYYLTAIALAFGITLEEVVQGNMDKLTDRAKRGVMRGSGDSR
jgi:NTP pyrophosphatase (non-canonical NTP hydrolase)